MALYVNSKELDPYVCKWSLMCMWMHWIKTGESDRWKSESQRVQKWLEGQAEKHGGK